jgi:hypothetical protein
VRRSAPGAAALVLGALVLTACGGGSGSTGSSSGGSPATSAEAAWAKEVRAVMSYFENNVSAQVMPQIQDTYNQLLLEPLYRTYSGDLAKLARKLGATDAPPACVALRDQLTGDARRLAATTKALSDQRNLSEEEFGELLRKQGEKLSKYGGRLTALAAELHC